MKRYDTGFLWDMHDLRVEFLLRAIALDILACPHCLRVFCTTPRVLGKNIRCRACRQIFHVPKDTGGVPLGPPVAGLDEATEAPPPAVICEVAGRDARLCPTCNRPFFMKPAFVGKLIRCRGCKSPFRVTAAESAASTATSWAGASNQPLGMQSAGQPPQRFQAPPSPVPAAAPTSQRPAISEDMGDILDEIAPGECVPSVVRPSNAAALAPANDHAVANLIAIMLGGACALPATQLILWWVFSKDPLKVASSIPEVFQWLLPPHMRP